MSYPHKCNCKIHSPVTWQNINCNGLQFVSEDSSVVVTPLGDCKYDFSAIGGGGGSVESVGLLMPLGFSVSNSPITSSGVINVTTSLNGPVRGNGTGFIVGAINLTNEVSGILPYNNGGTGLNSLGIASQLIRVNSTATALEYFTPGFISGNQNITLSGDVSGSGTTSISTVINNSAVTFPKMQNVNSQILLGRSTISVGVVEEITIGLGLQLSGGILSVISSTNTLTIVPQSTSITVLSSNSGNVYTNEGAVGAVIFSLPPASSGLYYTFISQNSNTLTVDAATGDTIKIGANVTSSGGFINSVDVGSSITLVAINSAEWVATSNVGTWII